MMLACCLDDESMLNDRMKWTWVDDLDETYEFKSR